MTSCAVAVPRLQPSCSPDTSEGIAELTRWQKLRSLAQTKSLLPSSAPNQAIAAYSGLHANHVASSPLDQFAAPAMQYPNLAAVRTQPGQLASARARLLLQSQHEGTMTDSLDTDLQVEAVLRKAASRAACLAGLPRAPPSRSKVLANLRTDDCQPKVLAPAADISILSAFWHVVLSASTTSEHCSCPIVIYLVGYHHCTLYALQGPTRHAMSVSRDIKNDLPCDMVAVKQAGHLNSTHGNELSKSMQIEAGRGKQAAISAAASHQRITQALAKRRLKQLSAWFEAWSAAAKEGQVHLRGASSLLTWRKLLRIWKVTLLTLSRWHVVRKTTPAISVVLCKAIYMAQLLWLARE